MARVKLDFDEEDDVVEAAPPNTVAVDELQPNPENPRPSELEIDETADDLKERGQLQNINIMSLAAFKTAKPHLTDSLGPQPYVVVNGCRRLAGARKAKLPRLRYEQHDEWSENDIDEALVTENEHRIALNPLLLGRHLQRMLPRYGSARKLAAALKKQQAWVSQRLRLTELDAELQRAIEQDQIMFKVARECSRLHPELQPLLARGELSETVVRQWLVDLRLSADRQMQLWLSGPPFLPTESSASQAESQPANDTEKAVGEYPVLTPDPIEGSEAGYELTGDAQDEYPVLTSVTQRPKNSTASAPSQSSQRPQLVIKVHDRSPHNLATALREHLTEEEINELISELNGS